MELLKYSKHFPETLLLGGSTSSFQFEGAMQEGGRGPSVIDDFRLFEDVTDFNDASGHYHLWKEDIALAAEAGLTSYRFSISWSRIFPTGSGAVNPEGVAFYNHVIDELRKYHIEPIVTIYHFDYPLGLVEEYGGWINRKSIDDYEAYCRMLFEEYGDRVKYWLTINEQDHVIRIPKRMGLTGKEPDYDRLRYQANHNMCVASARAFKLCHEMLPGAMIGPALSAMPIYPASSSPEDVAAAADVDSLMVSYMTELHCKGKYPIRLKKYLSDRDIMPVIEDGDMELMAANPPSYLGINYYATACAKAYPSTPEHPIGRVEGDLLPTAEAGIYQLIKNENLPLTEYGLAIDAVGLRLLLENLYERYSLPLMITENGMGCQESLKNDTIEDDYRIDYLRKHLKQVNLAIDTGVEVLGYNLWSFIDLVSGRQGFRKRYGLVYVNRDEFDLKDLKRYKKKSFHWYQNVIETRGKSLYNKE
jgi:6-phospho-beta-glucosidase